MSSSSVFWRKKLPSSISLFTKYLGPFSHPTLFKSFAIMATSDTLSCCHSMKQGSPVQQQRKFINFLPLKIAFVAAWNSCPPFKSVTQSIEKFKRKGELTLFENTKLRILIFTLWSAIYVLENTFQTFETVFTS